MSELIDIFDANLTPAGHMDLRDAHRAGHWHRTFHCWVVSEQNGGSVLFQLRSKSVVSFPGTLDASAAGHLVSGEAIQDGVREVTEELGIHLTDGSLYDLGYRVEVADLENGDQNREYQAVSLLLSETPLSSYRPQHEEIDGLFWLTIRDGIDLFSGAAAEARITGIQYESFSGTWTAASRATRVADFVPRIQKYYLAVFIMAERLLQRRFPLAIS